MLLRFSAFSVLSLLSTTVLVRAADGVPDNPGWAKVAPILDKHCARCHAAGKTTGRFKDHPAGNFGFVLDEEELVRRNKLILGNADGSEIFVKILKGDMPKDVDDACFDGSATATTYCGLTKDETASLHDAINALLPPAAGGQKVAANRGAPVQGQPQAEAPPTTVVAEGPPPGAGEPPPGASDEGPPPAEGPGPAPQGPASAATPAPKGPVAAAPPNPAEPLVQQAAVPAAEAPPPPFITDRDIIKRIAEDSEKLDDTVRPNVRYFTFTHLLNAGEPEKNLKVFRMALSKLLNSLSTESDPVVPVAVDPQQTIYRVDISALGWNDSIWNEIVASDPYVILYQDPLFRSLESEFKTQVPFVRADWFTFAASRPPLYYDILKLPKTRQELQAKLGVDAARDFASHRIERAGFQHSGVSENNREIERHAISTGAYWESYDFGSNGDRKSLFQFPLGPTGAFGTLSDRFGFNQDGGEIIFNLPNGFHAYYLTNGVGKRLDTGPTTIVHDPSQRDLAVTNGISCMGCHDKGIKYNEFRPGKPLDQVRDLVLRSGSYSADVKNVVAEIFPTGDAFNRRLDSDAKHYADALAAAGVNMRSELEGVEMINALSKRFEDNLNARLAAAEVGMPVDEFMDRLDAAGGQAHDLKLRLQQDVVPRDQFVDLFARLVNTINDNGDKAVDVTKIVAAAAAAGAPPVAEPTRRPPQTSKTFDLAFYANATNYRVGDLVTFTIQSQQPCFLTLFDTDDKGRTAVLFPNSSHPDAKIDAGVALDIPGAVIGGFKIKAPEPGVERVTASCNASFPSTLPQDFSKEKFTTFENTRALLAAQTDTRAQQQQVLKSRLLSVEPDDGSVAPAPVGHNRPTAEPQPVVAKASDRIEPITAQKSVVLYIRGR